MFIQRLLSRTILAVTVIGLLCPMLMGPGCPVLDSLTPLNGDPADGQRPGDSPGDTMPAALQINTGPDRDATVGSAIVLSATVEGGEEPYVASWSPASSLTDAGTLTPTFVPPAEGEYEFTLTVADRKGLSGSRTVKINALDHATLAGLKWGVNYAGGGYQLLAGFTKPLDKPTAENVNNYRTTPKAADTYTPRPGEIVAKVSVKPSSAKLSPDGLAVTLLFDSATLARNTRFDISVSDGILGADGVAVAEIEGLPAVDNSADVTAPTVVSRRWATGTDVSDAETETEDEIWDKSGVRTEVSYSYIIDVVFSEAMDPAPATDPAAYRIQEGSLRYTPSIAELANDGRTVRLIFTDGPLSQQSQLDIGLTTMLDMNGRKLVLDTGKSVTANGDDKTAPKIVANSVRFLSSPDDGYQVTITFDEHMDRITCETAANYLLDGHPASTAVLDSDGRRVVATFEGLSATTGSKLSIPANRIKDINGVSLAAQNNLSILSTDSQIATPGVPALTWLPGDQSTGYQIRAEFALIMDKTTVENVSNWRVAGTDTHPTSVVLHSLTDPAAGTIAGRTALISFSNVVLNRRTQLDVSVGASILDIGGNALEEVIAPIVASEDDVTDPSLAPLSGQTEAKPIWGDILTGEFSKTQYTVSLAFSEAMDGLSATNPENYLLGGTQPTAAQLSLDGRTVVLTFGNVAGLMISDPLQIYSTVRDINGRANASVVRTAILPGDETTAPTFESLYWLADSIPYQVLVEFSEVMDGDSVGALETWRLSDVVGIKWEPTAATLDAGDPTKLVLTFDYGVFSPDAELSLNGEVRDINGNAYDGSGGGLTLPAMPSADPADFSVPQVISAVWGADSSAGYLAIVQFSEAIDANQAGTFTLDGIASASVQVADGGDQVTVVFPNPATPTVFNRDARITVSAVQDMKGNISTTTVKNVAVNPLDISRPRVLETVWAANYGSAPDEEGYQIVMRFSEVLDALTAQLWVNYQITGTFSKPASAVLRPADGRTVVLTFPPQVLYRSLSVDDTLDASTGNSVYDVNGLAAFQNTLRIKRNLSDATPPTVVNAAAAVETEIEVVFSESLDRISAETLGNYVLAPGVDNLNPTVALLETDGRTVTLRFDQPVTGLMLRVSVGKSIADLNGNKANETNVGPM